MFCASGHLKQESLCILSFLAQTKWYVTNVLKDFYKPVRTFTATWLLPNITEYLSLLASVSCSVQQYVQKIKSLGQGCDSV
jgi:hypothetical protein